MKYGQPLTSPRSRRPTGPERKVSMAPYQSTAHKHRARAMAKCTATRSYQGRIEATMTTEDPAGEPMYQIEWTTGADARWPRTCEWRLPERCQHSPVARL